MKNVNNNTPSVLTATNNTVTNAARNLSTAGWVTLHFGVMTAIAIACSILF